MSGLSSCRNFSTIGIRARTELMFQDAILRVEDIGCLLAGGRLGVDAGRVRQEAAVAGCRRHRNQLRKGPRSGGVERGPPSVVYARTITSDHPGNRGKTRSNRRAIAALLLAARSCRPDE